MLAFLPCKHIIAIGVCIIATFPYSQGCSGGCSTVHCYWNNWEPWQPCSQTCGGGRQYRSRTSRGPECGGNGCSGLSLETQSCSERLCRVDCKWSSWVKKGSCSHICGKEGTQTSTRFKISEAQNGGYCDEQTSKLEPCNREKICPPILKHCGKDIDGDFVVGGSESNQHWPYMASLGEYTTPEDSRNNKWKHFCGATLITEKHVLTAAHCLFDGNGIRMNVRTSSMVLRFGQKNLNEPFEEETEQTRTILKAEEHDKYDHAGSRYYDIAILEVEPLEITNTVHHVCLPQIEEGKDERTNDLPAAILGYGAEKYRGQSENKLKEAQITMFTRKYCNEKLEVPTDRLPQMYADTVICAGSTLQTNLGSCKGDSGGPLIRRGYLKNYPSRWVQLAVVSGDPKPGICGHRDMLGQYIRLNNAEIMKFIKEKTNNQPYVI